MLLNSSPVLLLHTSCCRRNWLLELKISPWNSDLAKALQAFAAVSTEAKAMGFRTPVCQSPKKSPWISLLPLGLHYQQIMVDLLVSVESFLSYKLA